METAIPTLTANPPAVEKEKEATLSTTYGGQLPSVTTSTAPEYIHGLALASARASADDPLSMGFEAEKLESKSLAGLNTEDIRQLIYKSCTRRLNDKLSRGAFIAEAASFAAVACWEPLESNNYPKAGQITEIAKSRPMYAEFVMNQEQAKRQHLYPICEKYWHLSMMARDPTIPYVPGAVRAVMVPFIERFTKQDRLPVWLEAGSQKARDVYAHFGFEEVGSCTPNGIRTWFMIYKHL